MNNNAQNPIRYGASTDCGLVRTRNEDALAVDLDNGVVVVSDGMGGSANGAVASEIVVSMLPQMVVNRMRGLSVDNDVVVKSALRSAVADLSDQLYAKTSGSPDVRGMGATVVAGLIRAGRIHIAYMGDSRAYLMHGSCMARITHDHSVVSILERRLELSPQQAPDHAARGYLTRFVGMPFPALPDVTSVIMQRGDRIMMCTDGLTGMLDDDSIAAVLRDDIPPQDASACLVKAAIAAGGLDNITVLVLDWLGYG